MPISRTAISIFSRCAGSAPTTIRANRGRYSNPQLDSLLARARVEPDDDRRKLLFVQAQQIIAADVPYISLWFNENICVHRTRIAGIELSPAGNYDFLSTIQAN
jgi:peptide/nickel transport system substrate-binding protein